MRRKPRRVPRVQTDGERVSGATCTRWSRVAPERWGRFRAAARSCLRPAVGDDLLWHTMRAEMRNRFCKVRRRWVADAADIVMGCWVGSHGMRMLRNPIRVATEAPCRTKERGQEARHLTGVQASECMTGHE